MACICGETCTDSLCGAYPPKPIPNANGYLVALSGVGAPGPAGPAGPAGEPGADSTVPGPPGPAGERGERGEMGAVGPQGIPGQTGATGPAGADSTVPGPTGDTGSPGATGATGATGARGPVGPVGATGPGGPAGSPGGTGPQGEPGKPGATGSAGATGPAGPAGSPGLVGPAGPQGIPGLGVTFKGSLATVDALPVDAVQGDLWLVEIPAPSHGWVWDEAEQAWIDAGQLQGPTGPAGATGQPGSTGATGAAGPAGPAGEPGSPGAVGAQGEPGQAGSPGADGAPGEVGPEGPKGDTGADGAAGSPGAVGAQGEVGPEGPVGPVGPEGPQGPKGDPGAGSAYTLPAATTTVLGGVKVGTGLAVTADGTLSSSVAGNFLVKSGDAMTGALRFSSTGVSTYNGSDVYMFWDGTYFRCRMPGADQGWIVGVDGKTQFPSAVPKCNFAPTETGDLTNKAYVDGAVSGSTAFLKLSGGTMTGTITAPTTVAALTFGTSGYNVFGASGGVAVRSNNANIVNFTASEILAAKPITTAGAGEGVRFGSGGPSLSRAGAAIAASAPITVAAAPINPTELANKQYVDDAIAAALAALR